MTVLQPPRNLTATEITPMLVTVTWQPPIVTEGTILRYELRIINSSQKIDFTIAASNLRFTAMGLSPFTNYIFEVRGVSEAGQGRIATLAVHTGELGMLCSQATISKLEEFLFIMVVFTMDLQNSENLVGKNLV